MKTADILDGAFKLFKANARTVMLMTAAFALPVQIVSGLLQRNIFDGEGIFTFLSDPSAAQVEASSGRETAVAVLISGLAVLLVQPFVAGAVARVVAASYLGEEMTGGDAVRILARRWWVFVVAFILVHICEAIGFVLCVLPFFLVMALFIPVSPVIAMEGTGPIATMRRSASLVRPRLFPVVWVGILSGFLSAMLGMALAFVPQTVALIVGLRWGWLLLVAGEVLASMVTTPFIAIVATLVYFDARIRQEGLDLQIMAAQLGGASPPAGGPTGGGRP